MNLCFAVHNSTAHGGKVNISTLFNYRLPKLKREILNLHFAGHLGSRFKF